MFYETGINSIDVEFDAFECKDMECRCYNEAGYTTTDDAGYYEIACSCCNSFYRSGYIREERKETW